MAGALQDLFAEAVAFRTLFSDCFSISSSHRAVNAKDHEERRTPAELALLRSLMLISYHGCTRARMKKGDFMRGLYFFPLTALFIIGFFLFLIFLFIFIEVGLIGYAYERLGISAHLIFPLLLLSLLGSSVNIPVTYIKSGPVITPQKVDFF